MARLKRQGIRPLLLAALWFGAGRLFFAQSVPAQPGSISGKLTDLRSAPLSGVTVVLRNVATGAEARTTTSRNGVYRFAALDAGQYTMEADSPQLGRGRLEGIVVSPGHEARTQAAIEFGPGAAASLVAAIPAKIPAKKEARQIFIRTPPEFEAREIETIPEPATETAPTEAPAPIAPNLPAQTEAVTLPSLLSPPAARQLAALKPEPGPVRAAAASSLRRIAGAGAVVAPTFAASLAAAQGVQAVLRLHPPFIRPILAAAERADPVAPAVDSTMTATVVQALPASGRRWQDFLLDTPASAAAGASGASLRGASPQSTDITIDGSSTRLAFGAGAIAEPRTEDSGSSAAGGAPNGMGESWNGGTGAGARGFSVSEAGIRAVQAVAGNVQAEGARAAGGRVNLETARGENQLHGQGFLFDRQNNWGARNPYTQWVENTGSGAAPVFTPEPYTPPDHETVWGFGLGSPLRRDRLFWFAALDSYRRNDPGLATVKYPDEFFFVPTPNDAQIQLLSAQLGESENQAYNDYLGVPTAGYAPAGLEQLANLLGPAPRTAAQWTGFARIDWKAAERHRFTLEGIGASWNAPGGGLTRLSESYGNHSFGASQASQQWLLARWEAFLTANLLATTQVSAGRDILTARPDAPSGLEQGLLTGNVWGQLPQIVVDSRYGFTIGNPSRFGQGSYPDERLYHAQEMVDWVRNRLLVKAGFEVDHNNDATSLLRNQTGTYYYSKVQNFISDALAYEKFGLSNALDFSNPHNCGPTGSTFGSMPCYSYYSQTMGPTNWQLSTSDWAGYATAQWQTGKLAVFSAGLRWEREQLPPPLAALANPELPLAERLPSLGNNWGPRASLAIGNAESRWPVLRLGYGLYYGRTENATLETALTQTGSSKGDLSFFMRPSDDCQYCAGGSPPFPYVFAGEPANVVKPGAVEFAPSFRNPEVHQAVASLEEALPGHALVTAAALLSLGRRLPVSIDTNFNPAVNPGTITYGVVDGTGLGPIKSSQITVPFYASWPTPTGIEGRLNPDYQQISEIVSRANSTYEAAMVKIDRYGRRGLSLHAHYTYAHAMDWNPNETTLVAGSDVLDPGDFSREYGTSNLDVRHSAAAMVIYEAPWKLHNFVGHIANGWMLSGIG
ncbi:MAG: carboxypeptidase regulatory-like domain-containing protein, partial [Terracidiphilus sp.]